jgi:hypothetical protein
MELLYLFNSLDKKVTKIIYSVAESLGEVAIGLDATVAEEGPPAAHLLGVSQVKLDDDALLLVLRCFVDDFALRTGDEGGAPE